MIGARLKQARLLVGMTQRELASALGDAGFKITAAAISKYEKEKSSPSARFLLSACRALNVAPSYLSHQPQREVKWTAFRRQSQFGKKMQDRVKAYAADIAELQIELHTLLYPRSSSALPDPVRVSTIEEAERLANRLRSQWEVGNRPLDNLVQIAEDRGLIVIAWDDDSDKFDGLSGWCGAHPVIVINENRSTDRLRFSLAHEIGHLVMDASDVGGNEEALAHRFAAALLVPPEQAYHELGRKRNALDWEELKLLKRKYGMSMSAWIRRARDLEIISERTYKDMNIALSSRGWRKKEPADYVGDEEPLQLEQMVQRVVAEGLVSPDRFISVGIKTNEPECQQDDSGHLTVRDLKRMPEDKRVEIMDAAFAAAAEVEFEIFEAFGLGDEDADHGDFEQR